MEIGVVVHGPGIIDSGWAVEIINFLSNFGHVQCRLGGTMGRTAVIDAALEDIIDISLKLLPSESLELFNRNHVDVIFLLNYGKSQETGQVFGYKTFNHYFKKISNEDYLATNHKPLYDSKVPVIQIERPGEEDGSIISWNVVLNEKLSKKKKRSLFKSNDEDISFSDFEELFEDCRQFLNLNKVTPEEVIYKYFSDNEKSDYGEAIDEIMSEYMNSDDDADYTFRKIHGVSPGENIFVNSTVIGYSDSDSLVLVARDGMIFDIIGGHIKEHGVDKLGPVDLDNVIVKTGLLRNSSNIQPRILDSNSLNINDTERNLYSEGVSNLENSFKIAFVDHAAYDIYRFKNFDLVVTIGDDTTLVSSDILYRLNIPIIGITDGDLDKVVQEGFIRDDSIIIEVASGFDDIVGQNIYNRLFSSNNIIEIPFNYEYDSVEEFKKVEKSIFKYHLIDVVKSVVPTFIEKSHLNPQENLPSHEKDSDSLFDEGNLYDENPEEIYSDNINYDETYIEQETPICDNNEIYVEHDVEDLGSDEIYVEHDVEDLGSDEIYVEHDVEDLGSDEIYVEHNDSELDYDENED